MFVACAPYLIASMARAEGVALTRGSAIAIGLVAGVALAMKPHYLAIPAAVELYLLIRRGWRDDAHRSHPVGDRPRRRGACRVDVHDLRRLRPVRAAARRRGLCADRRRGLARRAHQQRAGAHPDRAGDLRRYRRDLHQDHLGARARGVRHRAAISAIAQAKGWPYHVLPALSAAILLAALTVSQTVDRYLPISRSGHHLPVAVISATLMVLLYFQAALYTPPFYKQRQFEDFDRRAPAAHHRAERAAPYPPGAFARHLSAMAADQLCRRAHEHALPQHVGAAGRVRDLRRLPCPLQSARHDGRFGEVRVRRW